MDIHFSVFSFSHIEGITLGVGEEVDEVVVRASGKRKWSCKNQAGHG